MIDIATWESILDRLEDQEDFAILQSMRPNLERLAAGERPEGWLSWEKVEKELDELPPDDDSDE